MKIIITIGIMIAGIIVPYLIGFIFPEKAYENYKDSKIELFLTRVAFGWLALLALFAIGAIGLTIYTLL